MTGSLERQIPLIFMIDIKVYDLSYRYFSNATDEEQFAGDDLFITNFYQMERFLKIKSRLFSLQKS